MRLQLRRPERSILASQTSIACFCLALDQSDAVVAALAEVLSTDEHERAARFAFPGDRRRFVVTRGCLRGILGRLCSLPASSVRFDYAPIGKPALAIETARKPVHFNVSHSRDLAVIAVAVDLPLGVDLEAVRPVPDRASISSRYFTAVEAASIATVAPHERDRAFFLCWTRKEAFAKALGDGLSIALDRYHVTCRPDEPARLLEVDGSTGEAAAWSVYDLRPAPGFVGAVAMRAGRRRLLWTDVDVEDLVFDGLN